MHINYSKAWTQIELTDYCNLSCIMCEQGGLVSWNKNSATVHNRRKDFIDISLFDKIIDDFGELGKFYEISPFWLGEASVHPEFSAILDILSKKGSKIFQVFQLHSNMNLINKKNIESLKKVYSSFNNSKLVISIDAFNPQTYSKIRIGGNLLTVIRNTKEIIKMKKDIGPKMKLIIQFIVMEQNKNECYSFYKFWEKIFLDLNMDVMPLLSFESYKIHEFSNPMSNYIYFEILNTHSYEKEKNITMYKKAVKDIFPEIYNHKQPKALSKENSKQVFSEKKICELRNFINKLYITKNSSHLIEIKLLLKEAFESCNYIRPCGAIFYSPYIASNGDITVCCLDSKMDLKIGSLKNDSLRDLWEGNELNELRINHITQNFNKIHRCKICVNRGQRSQNRNDFSLSFEETVEYLNSLCK